MSIFDSPSESEDEQQIAVHKNYYYNSHFVEDDVSSGLLSFLCLLLMSLGLFALFEYQYQLYYVNVNNNTDDSFLRYHNTNDSLI